MEINVGSVHPMGGRQSRPSPLTRDPRDWPFASDSPWNQPIGTGANYVTIQGITFTEFVMNAIAWSIPVFRASSSDPMRAVTPRLCLLLEPDGCDGSPLAPHSIRVPDNAAAALPTVGGDKHLSICDPDGSHVWELYDATRNADGNWKCLSMYKNDLTGMGAGFSCGHGTRAYGGSSLGGLIRGGELANGIKHAVAVAADPAYVSAAPGTTWVWPASSSDGDVHTTNVYESTLLAIPADVDINALGLRSIQGFNVARALQLYGAYVVDRGSVGMGLIIYLETNARAEYPGPHPTNPFWSDMRIVASLLKIVSNNGPDSVGGGGTPLTAPAPAFGTSV